MLAAFRRMRYRPAQRVTDGGRRAAAAGAGRWGKTHRRLPDDQLEQGQVVVEIRTSLDVPHGVDDRRDAATARRLGPAPDQGGEFVVAHHAAVRPGDLV